jgi:hypothetical protein
MFDDPCPYQSAPLFSTCYTLPFTPLFSTLSNLSFAAARRAFSLHSYPSRLALLTVPLHYTTFLHTPLAILEHNLSSSSFPHVVIALPLPRPFPFSTFPFPLHSITPSSSKSISKFFHPLVQAHRSRLPLRLVGPAPPAKERREGRLRVRERCRSGG